MPAPDEDKKESRVHSARVEIRVKGTAHGERPIYGTLTNLSCTGAFLQSKRSLTVGTELNLVFELHANEKTTQVSVRGEVKHRGRGLENGVGIRFIRLSRDAALAIEHMLLQSELSE